MAGLDKQVTIFINTLYLLNRSHYLRTPCTHQAEHEPQLEVEQVVLDMMKTALVELDMQEDLMVLLCHS